MPVGADDEQVGPSPLARRPDRLDKAEDRATVPGTRTLLARVFAQIFAGVFGGKDIAVGVGGHTFGADLVLTRVGTRDEIFDRAVAHAADADAAAAAGIGGVALIGGLRVGDVDRVVPVDEHATRLAELRPFHQVL